MAKVALLLEYNGAGFSGWQVQPAQRTIQGELEKKIELVLRHPVRLVPSGRTDAGVHSRGQVAVFKTSCSEVDVFKLQRSLSELMKPEVAVLRAGFVPEDFHPRKRVKAKVYRYTLERRLTPPVLDHGRVWHVYDTLDMELLKTEAQSLVGTHDFSSMRAAGCGGGSPVKTIHAVTVEEAGTKLVITFRGSGFLKHMVRIIVGTLVDLARGGLGTGSICEILQSKDRTQAGRTAPAHALEMLGVIYETSELNWLSSECV